MERYMIFNILSLLCLIAGLILTIVGSYYTDYWWVYDDSTGYIVCIVIGCILTILAIVFGSIGRRMRRRMYYGQARPAMVQVQYAQPPMTATYITPGSNVAAYPGPPPTYQYNNFSASNGYPQQQYPPQSVYPAQQAQLAQPSYATDFKS